MRKLILATQVSVDGYLEGPAGALDWLIAGDQEWTELFKDLQSADTFLLGRNMFPGYAGYWRSLLGDTSGSKASEFARLADRTPHIVFSKTLTSTDWNNTTIARDAATDIPRLKQQPGKDMIAWGGAGFAASLIQLGLVDEYRLTLNPTVLGGGKPLFPPLTARQHVRLIETRPLASGIVIIRYQSVK